MARLQNSQVILRFRLGKAPYQSRQRWENTYRYIAQNVVVTYAQNSAYLTVDSARQAIQDDIEAELARQATFYRNYIIGLGASLSQPTGVLSAKAPGAAELPLSEALPAWAPRSAKYLKRKRATLGQANWFDGGDVARRAYGESSTQGYLFQKTRADDWASMFGPIEVAFRANKDQDAEVAAQLSLDGRKTKLTAIVGTFTVKALGKITPDMLPGLRSGNTVQASSEGNAGLMRLVAQSDPQLAYRLDARRYGGRGGNKPYRPTLEPFLTFFLTEAIPAAVAARLAKGGLGRL